MRKLKSYPNRQIGKGNGNWRRAPKTLKKGSLSGEVQDTNSITQNSE